MNLLHDLRFTIRYCLKQPAFAITAVAVLALGIGASTAVFSVLYQALLKPLPYPHAERLVMLHNIFPKRQISAGGVSGFDYSEISRRRDLFEDAAVFYWNDLTLTGLGSARHMNVVNASASLFSVLQIKPQLGRVFTQSEDRSGAPGTAVLSDGLWRNMFNNDPGILGRNIRLNGLPYTVVGVMPPGFQFPSRETEIWIPTAFRPGETTLAGGRSEKWLHMIARIRPGVSLQEAESGLQAVTSQMGRTYSPFYPTKEGWHFALKPLAEEQTDSVRRWLYLAFGAVLSVLLIACINVSGLFLIRGSARSGEFAVRRAMGAAKHRIVGQLLTETGLLVLCGCGVGLLVADWLVHFVNLYGPMPQPSTIQSWTILFTLLLALISTVLVGLTPALIAADLPIDQTLRSSSRRTTARSSAFRYGVVAAQIAVAVTLVFIAAQLNRSFLNLTRVPAGFTPDHVWTGMVTLSNNAYAGDQAWNTRFFEPLLRQLRSLPGIKLASGANAIPFSPSGVWTEQLRLPNRPKMNPPPEAQISVTFPEYFEAMGIPLRKGRTFTDHDRAGQTPVAVIDEELAHRYFQGEDPIGKPIITGGEEVPARIVGVVGSVHNSSLGGPSEPEIYYPELQERADTMYLVLRATDASDPAAAVRHIIDKLDSNASLYDVQFMPDRLAESLKMRRFIALLLNGLAGTGLILALVGLYGSLAHLVQLRHREIGIRLALGAMQSQVCRIIILRAGAVVGAGLIVGVFGAVLAERTVRSQLFGVQLTDPATWFGVIGAVGIASAVSAWIPASRAAKIAPSETLRAE